MNAKTTIAPEFVSILEEQAVHAFGNWAKSNGLPDIVRELPSNVSVLAYYAASKGGQFDTIVLEAIVDTVNAVAELGGQFHSGESYTPAREPVKWTPPATLAAWLATYERLSTEDQQVARAWMRTLVTQVVEPQH